MDSAAFTARLRKFRPSRLVAVGPTGEKRSIAVPSGRRRRWDFVLRNLEQIDWVTLELLDESGAILDIIDHRADDDSVAVEVTPDARLAGNLELMLRAQDVALARHEKAFGQLIAGYTQLAQTTMERLSAMERNFGAMLSMAQNAAIAQAQAQPDMGDEIVKQFLPGVVGKVMGSKTK